MKRAGPEDYKQLAKRCAEIASECSEPTVAAALRALALDYTRRAAKLRRREPIEFRQGRHRIGRPNRFWLVAQERQSDDVARGAASSWRTPPSLPRVSARNRVLAGAAAIDSRHLPSRSLAGAVLRRRVAIRPSYQQKAPPGRGGARAEVEVAGNAATA